MSINTYLDKARELVSPASDYELARQLGIRPSSISHYRHGRSTPEIDVLIGLAEILEIDPLELIALVNADRAKKDRERAFWKNLLSTMTVVCFGIALAFSVLQTNADSSTVWQLIHYAQLIALAWFLTLGAFRVNKSSRNHARPVPAALA